MSIYPNYHVKIVEPIKRNKDGVKWIIHRFPIKNGISMRDAMIYDMLTQPNQFIEINEDSGAVTFRGIPVRVL